MVLKQMSAAILGVTMALGSLAVGTPAQARPSGEAESIVGGRQATEAYPFLVFLPSACVGVLIKSNWVATAGHCSTPRSVRIGSTNRTSGGTVATVDRAIIHTGADLKVLRLTTNVTQQPLPIQARPPAISNVVRVIGWGQTCAQTGCGAAPTVARELDSTVTRKDRCSATIDVNTEMCIGAAGAGACFGDSGGPVIQRADDRWLLVGVVSRLGGTVATCALDPWIATDLPTLRDWISDSVGGGLPS